ncbi:hypothetical protein RND81_14G091600 [Saponaria officinalis]|uniref:Uncharacterized protein n=1 Tax=Saponaria officinalis TaxID=3572 RepID=A0AAW1GKY6_SAPOF
MGRSRSLHQIKVREKGGSLHQSKAREGGRRLHQRKTRERGRTRSVRQLKARERGRKLHQRKAREKGQLLPAGTRKRKAITVKDKRKWAAETESESESEDLYEDSDDDELTDTELQFDEFEKGVREEEDLFTDKSEAAELLSKVQESLGGETGGRSSSSNVDDLDVNNAEGYK